MLQTSNKKIDWQPAYKEKLFQFNLDNKNLSKIELEDNSKQLTKIHFYLMKVETQKVVIY